MWTHATPDRTDSRPDSAAEHRASAGHDRNAEETSDKDTANAFVYGRRRAQLVAHDRPGKAVGASKPPRYSYDFILGIARLRAMCLTRSEWAARVHA